MQGLVIRFLRRTIYKFRQAILNVRFLINGQRIELIFPVLLSALLSCSRLSFQHLRIHVEVSGRMEVDMTWTSTVNYLKRCQIILILAIL